MDQQSADINQQHLELTDRPKATNLEASPDLDLPENVDLENAIGAALGLLGFLTETTQLLENGPAVNSKSEDSDVLAQLARVADDVYLSLESQITETTEKTDGASAGRSRTAQMTTEWNDGARLSDINSYEPSGSDIDNVHSLQAGENTNTKNIGSHKQGDLDIDPYALELAAEIAKKVAEDGLDDAVEEDHDESNVDLESAINDVFKKFSSGQLASFESNAAELSEGLNSHIDRNDEGTSTNYATQEQRAESPAHESLVEGKEKHATALDDGHGDKVDDHAEAEVDLDDVIGQAFRAIIEPSEEPKEKGDPFQDFKEPVSVHGTYTESKEIPTRDLDDVAIDLEGIVQNVVQQMARDNDAPSVEIADTRTEVSNTSTNESLLNRPASEKRAAVIPKLDETVLEHFEMNTVTEESHIEPSLKSMYSSSGGASSTNDQTDSTISNHAEKESELEKLQMNEILQNAFNMAMLNPQELLAETMDNQNITSERRASISAAAAISVLRAGDAINNAAAVGQTHPSSTKPLSIAETLALHRSTMANEKREVFDIQSIKASLQNDSSGSLHPQLSNILSSLSLHIQSGTQSQNLMLVIRQMTNSLMLNKNFSLNVNTAVLKLLMEVSTSPEEKAFVIDSLKNTRHFLNARLGDEEAHKALALVDNVLTLLAPKTQGELSTDTASKPEPLEAHVSSFYDQAYSTLATFSNSRLRNTLLGGKPDTDSDEYKERVRIENRERKKKWREENAERNKDNDLRSRVIKRANIMFGEIQLPEKRAWIEEEFNRRREKRISRQKQEEVKLDTSTMLRSSTESKSSLDTVVNDSTLVRRITDIFNLVAECGSERDPRAVMTAASAAIAVATSSVAEKSGINDPKPMQNAISLILSSILEANVKSGSYKRIPFLTKDLNAGLQSEDYSKISGYENTISLGGDSYTLDNIKEAQKRFGNDFLTSDMKRTRNESISDQSRPTEAYLNSSAPWSTVSALKMPKYKKPSDSPIAATTEKYQGFARTLPRGSSPFLSNKMGYDLKQGMAGGLKRPGSFQRPVVKTGQRTGKPLSFPTFYSSTYSQK